MPFPLLCAALLAEGVRLPSPAESPQVGNPSSVAEQARFAVVRPFWKGDIPGLENALRFMRSNHTACANGTLPVDLVLYYSGGKDDIIDDQDAAAGLAPKNGSKVGELLAGLTGKLAAGAGCFREVRVKYSDWSAGYGYPSAPCMQFMEMMNHHTGVFWGYQAIYQMELDVRPVRETWLEHILPIMEDAARGKFWVVGGTYNLRCMALLDNEKATLWDRKVGHRADVDAYLQRLNTWWTDGHINGNAVYSSSADFRSWVQKRWPKDGRPRCARKGQYDGVFFGESRTKVAGAAIANKWLHSDNFVDCKPVGPHSQEARTMPLEEVRKRFPTAMLAHVDDTVLGSARPHHS